MIRTSVSTIALALLASAALAQSAFDALPGIETLPEGVVQLSSTVPGMGERYGNPADLPLGPIYCVHQGKIVCLEFMIVQVDFAAGQSWPALAGMEGLRPVNHTNIGFEAHGHEGFEVPDYNIHMYFLSPEDMAPVQPQ